MADFALTVIGSGSALPMHGRHPSSQVIQYGDFYCMIDCGESTQMRLRSFGIRLFKIDVVLISHLHGDHVFGLPGLLSSYSHLQRKNELTIYGPVGIKELLNTIVRLSEMHLSYPVTIIEIQPEGLHKIFTKGNIEVYTFPLFHRIPCNGYLLKEISPILKLRKESILSASLSIEQIQNLQQGKDIEIEGQILKNNDFTIGNEHLLSYAYCSDTKYNESIVDFIKHASVLYHETTFDNSLSTMAKQTGHSTAGEAGLLAKKLGVSCLITGHYSSRYKEVDELLIEARVHVPHVLEAEEGKRYNLRLLSQQEIDNEGHPERAKG